MAKNKKFSGLNANLLEIKRQAQRGMTFLILTNIFVIAAKKLNFYGLTFLSKIQKSDFCKKCVFFGFYIVVQPNEGVQRTDRLF